MNPSFPDPVPSGVDYLNQIAPPAPPTGIDKKTKIIIFIMILLGVASLAIIAAGASSTNKEPTLTIVAGRLQKVYRVASAYKNKLNSSELRGANGTLIALMTTANKSVLTPLANSGVDVKKNAKVIATMDSSAKLEEKLNDAYLNAQLDETYGREMLFLLQDTTALVKKVSSTTRSKSSKEFLEKTIVDLTGITDEFRRLTTNDS